MSKTQQEPWTKTESGCKWKRFKAVCSRNKLNWSNINAALLLLVSRQRWEQAELKETLWTRENSAWLLTTKHKGPFKPLIAVSKVWESRKNNQGVASWAICWARRDWSCSTGAKEVRGDDMKNITYWLHLTINSVLIQHLSSSTCSPTIANSPHNILTFMS